MLDTRWSKVLADLSSNKVRTLLVALSIAIGIFCVGMVAGARTIILDDLNQQYAATKPAGADLTTVTPFGEGVLRSFSRFPGIRTVEARYRKSARIEVGNGEWKDLVLFAIPDFHHMTINKVWPQQGAWPPPQGQLLIERDSLAALNAHIGDAVRVEMPDGTQRTMRVAGTAHDLNQPATTVFGISYGYVTFPTLAWLGGPHAFNQLYLTTTGNPNDTEHVWRVVARVRSALERSGHQVSTTVVPKPGKLWVYDAVQSMLMLLIILGVFSLCMSGFLVVNTVSAQVMQQVHQIGIMKSVGGSPRQLIGMYLATILGYCALALMVAIPLGVIGALSLIGYSTHLLDFDTGGFGLSPQVLALEAAAGIAVPLLAALMPIVRGSRITVRDAIASRGTGGSSKGPVNLDLGPAGAGLPQPLLLSLGNTVRRKGRLALTLTAMILGGAIFIAVLSVRASLLHTLDQVFGYRNYDVQITFSRPYSAGRVTSEALTVPGVVRAEGWALVTGQRSGATGTARADVQLVGLPAGSSLIKPVLLHGRWLRPGDRQAIVVNSDAVSDDSALQVGRRVAFTVNGGSATWTIVGTVRGVQAGPIAYVSYPALTGVIGQTGLVDRLQVVTDHHDGAGEAQIARALEVRLKHAGLAIDSTQTTVDQRNILGANFDTIVVFLLVMALILAAVGGLGLMGTMSLNVLERTREIGIMRAVGASDRATLQVVMVEGLIIAATSWVLGAILSLPLSPLLSAAVGDTFIHAPVAYTFSAGGALIWLAGVVGIAALASFVPARHASRLTVRDVLAYE